MLKKLVPVIGFGDRPVSMGWMVVMMNELDEADYYRNQYAHRRRA